MTIKDLFEIPVYRLSKDKYYQKMETFIKAELLSIDDPAIKMKLTSSLRDKYGGNWEYNEIIGYLKLYKWGSKLRVYYYETNSKRKVKTRKKNFVKISDKYADRQIYATWTNNELIKEIKGIISQCEDILKSDNKNFYLDRTIFDSLVDKIDWKNI